VPSIYTARWYWSSCSNWLLMCVCSFCILCRSAEFTLTISETSLWEVRQIFSGTGMQVVNIHSGLVRVMPSTLQSYLEIFSKMERTSDPNRRDFSLLPSQTKSWTPSRENSGCLRPHSQTSEHGMDTFWPTLGSNVGAGFGKRKEQWKQMERKTWRVRRINAMFSIGWASSM
jgi:hypothetical protein